MSQDKYPFPESTVEELLDERMLLIAYLGDKSLLFDFIKWREGLTAADLSEIVK